MSPKIKTFSKFYIYREISDRLFTLYNNGVLTKNQYYTSLSFFAFFTSKRSDTVRIPTTGMFTLFQHRFYRDALPVLKKEGLVELSYGRNKVSEYTIPEMYRGETVTVHNAYYEEKKENALQAPISKKATSTTPEKEITPPALTNGSSAPKYQESNTQISHVNYKELTEDEFEALVKKLTEFSIRVSQDLELEDRLFDISKKIYGYVCQNYFGRKRKRKFDEWNHLMFDMINDDEFKAFDDDRIKAAIRESNYIRSQHRQNYIINN